MIRTPRRRPRDQHRHHRRDTFPTPWKRQVRWTWSTKRCPDCGEARWASKRLVVSWVRLLGPGRVQHVVKHIPRDRYPEDAEARFICPAEPKRRCVCRNRIDPRFGP